MTYNFLSSERYVQCSVSIRMHPGCTDGSLTPASYVLFVSLSVSFTLSFALSLDEVRLQLYISAVAIQLHKGYVDPNDS